MQEKPGRGRWVQEKERGTGEETNGKGDNIERGVSLENTGPNILKENDL